MDKNLTEYDFNSYEEVGVYSLYQDNGANLKNSPISQVAGGFNLIVLNHGEDGRYTEQMFKPYKTNDIWIRRKYWRDVSTEWSSWERVVTNSDLNGYIRKFAPNFATWNPDGYGNVHCTIDLSIYNGMGYILNISIGGNANKSYPLTFAHAINIYGEDDIIELLKSSTILNDFTFDNSILSLSLSGAYEGDVGIIAI